MPQPDVMKLGVDRFANLEPTLIVEHAKCVVQALQARAEDPNLSG